MHVTFKSASSVRMHKTLSYNSTISSPLSMPKNGVLTSRKRVPLIKVRVCDLLVHHSLAFLFWHYIFIALRSCHVCFLSSFIDIAVNLEI